MKVGCWLGPCGQGLATLPRLGATALAGSLVLPSLLPFFFFLSARENNKSFFFFACNVEGHLSPVRTVVRAACWLMLAADY